MKQKHITLFIAIFSFILLNTIIGFKMFKTQYISKDILRLHVVANSNSIDDQITKLKVESKLNNYISSISYKNKEELIEKLKSNKDNILKLSDSTLKENNKTYTSKLKIGKISYDKKQNMTLDMYAGTYDSVCLVLGDGAGKNIWSIIFPNEQTIDKIKELDTILPGISSIYEQKTKKSTQEVKSLLFPSLGLTL